MDKISFFNYETLISVQIPKGGWDGEIMNDNQFRLYAPPVADLEDYRSTISFRRGEMDDMGTEYFLGIVEKLSGNLENLGGYEHDRDVNFVLSSGDSPTVVRYFSWTDTEDTGLAFSQFQAYILYRPSTMFIVNAATQTSIADDWMPVLTDVLHSMRIIPEPPNWQ